MRRTDTLLSGLEESSHTISSCLCGWQRQHATLASDPSSVEVVNLSYFKDLQKFQSVAWHLHTHRHTTNHAKRTHLENAGSNFDFEDGFKISTATLNISEYSKLLRHWAA